MKKKLFALIFGILTVICLCLGVAGCADGGKPADTIPEGTDGSVLVVYFSATNHTKGIAEKIAHSTDGTLYSITPAVPYTTADLNYNNSSCRANREQNDPTARPEISGSVENIGQYDVIFLGYPIWWGQAPKIIYTFLESYDLSEKTIIPFCTSASSGIGNSDKNLHGSASGATWLAGSGFSGNESQSSIDTYVSELGFNKQ